jgi:hypothetical protein
VKLRICRFFAVGIKTKVFYLHPIKKWYLTFTGFIVIMTLGNVTEILQDMNSQVIIVTNRHERNEAG